MFRIEISSDARLFKTTELVMLFSTSDIKKVGTRIDLLINRNCLF